MLGAIKFIPRDEVERHTEEAGVCSKKRKYKDGAKDKSKGRERRKQARSSDSEGTGNSEGGKEASTRELKEDAKTRRLEAGLDWMLHAPERPFGVSAPSLHDNRILDSEGTKSHARELNPYISSGAEDNRQQMSQRPNATLIGDGGASWRLKALKRAQEQAAREGRKLDEIVEERWDSLATLTSSVTTHRAAPVNAHLHATRDRKSGKHGENANGSVNNSKESENGSSRGANNDRIGRHRHESRDRNREHASEMKAPLIHSTLSWKSRKKFEEKAHTASLDSTAAPELKTKKQHASNGSSFRSLRAEDQGDSSTRPVVDGMHLETPYREGNMTDSWDVIYEPIRLIKLAGEARESISGDEEVMPRRRLAEPPQHTAGEGSNTGLSANQVAAKAMRLRLMGKVKEADELLKDIEAGSKDRNIQKLSTRDMPISSLQDERPRQVTGHRLDMNTALARDKFRNCNRSYDEEFAGSIVRNKLYTANVEDEYDGYGNGLETERSLEKVGGKKKLGDKGMKASSRGDFRQIMTQQEQCQYCFENTRRPKHLVIAIANFTYLMIPPVVSLVPFHCYIVPMQHEGATRNVDDGVWQELRNFKKCLVQMFGDQGMGVLFLETAMGFTRQRRHCCIECIPVPSDLEKDAPLYFKKAIDEAEDEWSQHNAKKLIETRQKGLRNSIPKNFPYFHVEFGMQGGYCHVIDDESSFKPHFGLDVVAGMLEVPGGVSRHRRQDPTEQQRTKVKEFLKLWEPFDWTKMLD